ncbi:hypothetical protein PPL_10849 [Heterostelium album PN500]|uniref:Ankyrin repeat protein n=1 Tax=Heterostelium pallidum (strain ATCC 26659 / Pp 5 / PN500) TaxID=670386 RepID=D3BS57_HETP5|nr:hypothetical protein PPL_10849 [Heterostelium album PN500]EFA75794.1 hypothetical protein PPL_10849 [Heterostelium album PN500]|eukprot:XP_020427928.1 hypothetical protein PPL_10849 [Heterostelium album PN500]
MIDRFKNIFNIINSLLKNKLNNNNKSIIDQFDNRIINNFKELFKESISTALGYENIEVLKFIQNSFSDEIDYQRIHFNSINYHNLQLVEYLQNNGWFRGHGTDIMDLAGNGSLDVIQFLHFNRTDGCTAQAMVNAASKGNLAVVQFLNFNRTEGCNHLAIDYSLIHKHFDTAKWLLINRSDEFTTISIECAACEGNLEILQLLCEKNIVDINQINIGGKLQSIQYLLENTNFRIGELSKKYSIRMGDLDVIRFLNENTTIQLTWTSEDMDYAAIEGQMAIVRYLHENRTEGCSSNALEFAIGKGYLDVVQFLNENRTEGNVLLGIEHILGHSEISTGQFEVFKYIYGRYPFLNLPVDVMDHFAKFRDSTALQWFKENTTFLCTPDAYLKSCISRCVPNQMLSIVKWIRDNTTFPIPYETDKFQMMHRSCDILDFIKYLHQNGGTFSTNSMDLSNNLEITLFLHYNRTEGCTHQAITNAIQKGNFNLVKFLSQNRTELNNFDYLIYNPLHKIPILQFYID